ncbi:hypothetical protein [Paenibacillus glucanolyticus]|uniref:hypothetical protein n=1 Tax=Paenibacillus glucanolyticus TaxID=59843 RepID=UPI0018D3A5C1|nr:hypothetical protein [Paenibacillus glucanolyticus]
MKGEWGGEATVKYKDSTSGIVNTDERLYLLKDSRQHGYLRRPLSCVSFPYGSKIRQLPLLQLECKNGWRSYGTFRS